MSNSDPVSAGTGGVIGQVGGTVLPQRRVTTKTVDFLSIVAAAEGGEYRRTVKYPVYQFGNGRNLRIFTQDV
jgi:hypothetical protein